MRITKLHILVFFILVASASVSFYLWKKTQIEERQEKFKAAQERETKAEEEALKKMAESSVSTMTAQAPSAPPTETNMSPSSGPVSYTVQKGDTLWNIAKREEFFGQGHRWYDIWKANEDSVEDFDRIIVGQVILIPLDKPEGYSWPITEESKKEKILRRLEDKKSEKKEAPPGS